jgi:hypothetical protein
MADFGDLTQFLEEEPLSDLSWLDVDKDTYRHELETLPEQNLDVVPELQAHWKNLSEEEKFRLSPENRMPASATTPFWSERPHYGNLSEAEVLALVDHFTKSQVQAGLKSAQVIYNLKKQFDPRILKKASSQIKQTLVEEALFGEVYVDASVFPKCASGGVQKSLTASNRDALYVKAKSACAGCVRNQEGRCAVFEKELVFEVDYTEELWEHYKPKLARSKDLSDLDHLPVKQRLQQAFLRGRKEAHKPLTYKPVQKDFGATITAEDAVKRLMKANVTQEVVGNVRLLQKQLRWAKAMMQQPYSATVVDRVQHDADLTGLQDHLYVMGNLYADISFFETYKEAAAFLNSLDSLPPVIVGQPYRETKLKKAYTQGETFSYRKHLPEILNRYLLLVKGPTQKQAATHQASFDKLWEHFKTASEEDLRAFAQEVYAKPLPEKVRMYTAWHRYDPTQGMSTEQAFSRLAQMLQPQEKVANPAHARLREKVIQAMVTGKHDGTVEHALNSQPYLRDLKAHRHLLGQLYLDTTLIPEDQLRKMAKALPHLEALPLMTASNRQEFFKSPLIHGRIASRMSALKGVQGRDKVIFERKIVRTLSKSSAQEVCEVAAQVFSKPYDAFATSSRSAASGTTLLDEFEFGHTAQMPDLDIELNPEGPGRLEMELRADFIID